MDSQIKEDDSPANNSNLLLAELLDEVRVLRLEIRELNCLLTGQAETPQQQQQRAKTMEVIKYQRLRGVAVRSLGVVCDEQQ